MASASMPLSAIAARLAAADNSVAVAPASAPWKAPIGVRRAPVMTIGSSDISGTP